MSDQNDSIDTQSASGSETHQFQAEAKQLLHLMTHSLYSNREIFVRELISNASDACDKLRFEALKDDSLLAEGADLAVRIEIDKEANTITITDNGIGMNRQEVIENIGTIASSGTAKFLNNMTGDQKKDSALIGQFGVGFYSSFIVADRVEVFTRRAGEEADQGVYWMCEGEADYQLDQWHGAERGTRVVLHVKEDANEFLNDWQLRSVIKKYSDHIAIAVEMEKPFYGEEKDKPLTTEFEAVNASKALWTRSRSDISDDEYKEFYRSITSDFNEPLSWSHNRVEGKTEYTSLLYLPSAPLFDLYNRDAPKGLKLYIRRTFILDDAEQFLPLYLRFVKGVIDCDDLPLNVSREILQQSPQVDSIKSALTKRILDTLGKMAKKSPEDYAKFWGAFGDVLKEGPVEDASNQEKLLGLLRFCTTASEGTTQDQSLEQYIERMADGQDKIYYIVADSYNVASKSPLLESFRKNGTEVLLLTDRIDEWFMSNITEYKGKSFQDVSRGTLDSKPDAEDSDNKAEDDKEKPAILERVKTVLGDRVDEVRESNRLVESPACLVIGEQDMGAQMRRMMQAAGQEVPDVKPTLELNITHSLINRIADEADETQFADLVEIVFDQANLAVGQQLADPMAYVERINRLLLELGPKA